MLETEMLGNPAASEAHFLLRPRLPLPLDYLFFSHLADFARGIAKILEDLLRVLSKLRRGPSTGSGSSAEVPGKTHHLYVAVHRMLYLDEIVVGQR